MNWDIPQYAHIPLIHGEDGTKLSKRHGAVNILDLKNNISQQILDGFSLNEIASNNSLIIQNIKKRIKYFQY